MDLNRSYFEHQLAVMRASSAVCDAVRVRYQTDADGISRRIKQFQQTLGAAASESWDSASLHARSPAL